MSIQINEDNKECEYFYNGFCKLESDYCANCTYCPEKRGDDDFTNVLVGSILRNRLSKKGN